MMMLRAPDPPRGWQPLQWEYVAGLLLERVRVAVEGCTSPDAPAWAVLYAILDRMVDPDYQGRLFLQIGRGNLQAFREEGRIEVGQELEDTLDAWEGFGRPPVKEGR